MARRLTRSHSNLWDYERGHRLATVEIAADYERELGWPPVSCRSRSKRPGARCTATTVTAAGRSAPAAPSGAGRSAPASGLRGRPGCRACDPRSVRPARDREMAAGPVLARRGRSGEPRIILLRGDAGIGKSTLLAHLLAGARDAGWLALCGFCLQGAPDRLPAAGQRLGSLCGPAAIASSPRPARWLELFPRRRRAWRKGRSRTRRRDRRHLNLVVAGRAGHSGGRR